jgi:cephalosporin-C deacetylase-like acetyl esterase
MFEYDVRAPLDVEELSPPQDRDGVTVYDIAYASPREGKVTSYLVVPEGSGSFAGVLFLHPGEGDRAAFLNEAVSFARAGAVALSIDGPFTRPSPWRRDPHPREIDAYRDAFVQTVVDVRRGIDLLTSRTDINADRIGYVGHSYGATLGGVVAGVETRIKAYVLMAGLVAFSDWCRASDHPWAKWLRETLTVQQLARFVREISAIDAKHFVGQATPAWLLFQCGHCDESVSEEDTQRFFEAASEPKEIRWYDAGHSLNDRARQERMAWLGERLGLSAM